MQAKQPLLFLVFRRCPAVRGSSSSYTSETGRPHLTVHLAVHLAVPVIRWRGQPFIFFHSSEAIPAGLRRKINAQQRQLPSARQLAPAPAPARPNLASRPSHWGRRRPRRPCRRHHRLHSSASCPGHRRGPPPQPQPPPQGAACCACCSRRLGRRLSACHHRRPRRPRRPSSGSEGQQGTPSQRAPPAGKCARRDTAGNRPGMNQLRWLQAVKRNNPPALDAPQDPCRSGPCW